MEPVREAPRISATEVIRLMHEGERPLILDVRRHPDDTHIKGSRRIDPQDLLEADHVVLPVPHDRLIITYCTCPRETTSAKVALRLRDAGYLNAYPLLNGYEAWERLGFPTEPRTAQRPLTLSG